MSEKKHTPGPWKYGLGYRVRPDRGLDAQGREVGGPTIAEVNADADRCCPPPAEIEANGRLMAAAPELLAELEETANWLEERAIAVEKLGAGGRKGETLNPRSTEEAAKFRGRAVLIRTIISKAK